jgi:hypothetical protein
MSLLLNERAEFELVLIKIWLFGRYHVHENDQAGFAS